MKRGLIAFGLLTCMLASMVISVVAPKMAAAAPLSSGSNGDTFTFQDHATIQADLNGVGNVTFVDINITDGTHEYTVHSQTGNLCKLDNGTYGDIKLGGTPSWNSPFVYATETYKLPTGVIGDSCTTISQSVPISNPTDPATGQPAVLSDWQWDGNNITSLGGQQKVATFFPVQLDTSGRTYAEKTTTNACGAYEAIVLANGSTSKGTEYHLTDTSGSPGTPVTHFPDLAPYFSHKNCVVIGTGHTIYITGTQGQAAPGSTSSTSTGSLSIGCHIGISLSIGGILGAINPLNWLMCGLIEGLSGIIGVLDPAITSQLAAGTNGSSTDQPNAIFCTGGASCTAYQSVWASFRDIALGLMVIVGLVLLIAQAIGSEAIDAYTVRKALPRLLVAAIGISLSWPLMEFVITLSNDLGYGVRHLIEGTFAQGFHTSSIGVDPFTFGSALLGNAGLAVFGPVGILTLAGTAALSLLVAWVTLILRQVVIIMLIIASPIAIIAYVLPNTNRVYKLWSDTFIRTLLMFPMIAGMIALGHAFALVSNTDTSNSFSQAIAFIAYFAPYFMIPMTFRYAGGAMSALGGFVNNAAQPLQQGLSRARANNMKKRGEMYNQKFRTGGFKPIIPSRFQRANRLNRGLVNVTNSAGRRFNAGLIRGGLGLGARGETALEESLMEGAEHAAQEAPMKENATINGFNRLMVLMAKHGGDENAAMAELRTWYGSDRNEYNRAFEGHDLEEKLTDAQARLRNVGGYNAGRAVAAYLAMGRDGTAIRDVRDSGEIAAWVSEGSTATAYNLLSQVASDSKRVGRSELSPSQDHKAALVGATVAAHKGETVANFDHVIDGATMSGAGGEGAYTVMMNSPSRVVRGNVEHAMDIIRRYNADPSSVDFKDAAQAATVISDLQANVNYAKADNKITLNEAMAVGNRQQELETFLKSTPVTITDDHGNRVGALRSGAATTVVDDFGNEVRAASTGEDVVSEYKGGPPRNMTEEQRHEIARRAQEQAEQQNNQQNNPQGR